MHILFGGGGLVGRYTSYIFSGRDSWGTKMFVGKVEVHLEEEVLSAIDVFGAVDV